MQSLTATCQKKNPHYILFARNNHYSHVSRAPCIINDLTLFDLTGFDILKKSMFLSFNLKF